MQYFETLCYANKKEVVNNNSSTSNNNNSTNNNKRELGDLGELGLKKKCKLSELSKRYRVKRKRLKTVIEELKQRMRAKSAKVRNISKELNNLDRIESLIFIRRRCTQNSMEMG